MLITIYVGCNDKETKTQILSDERILSVINETVKTCYEGFTVTECVGYFTHEDGTTLTEKSFKIELFPYLSNLTRADKYQFAIKQICEILKTALNQESILVSIQEDIKTFFI